MMHPGELQIGDTIVLRRDKITHKPVETVTVNSVNECPGKRNGISDVHVNINDCYSGIARLDVIR